MAHRLHSWLLRSVLLGALPLALGSHGCAQQEDEGDYNNPPGFSQQQTKRVALSAFAFQRNERHQAITQTLLTRASLAAPTSQARQQPEADPQAQFRLEATFHGTYADGMSLAVASAPNAYVRVTPTKAQRAQGRIRKDGAVLSFEEAYPKVTSAFGARPNKVEEFLIIPTANDIPTLSYDLAPGPEFGHIEEDESGGSTLWAYSKDGAGLFTIAPPVADDAAGKHVVGSWKLEEHGGGYRITAQIDLKGLQFPVLLDPTFETPEWFKDTAGSGGGNTGHPGGATNTAASAGAFDINKKCSVFFGGVNASDVYNQSTTVRCSNRRWRSNVAPTNPPPARAYSAMAYYGGSTNKVFMFGGINANGGLLNDLWRLDNTCTVSGTTINCTGTTWTKITPGAGPWPEGRGYHGMAWNGSSLVLFGGFGTSPLRDTWEYNADTNTWTQTCTDCYGDYDDNGDFQAFFGASSTTIVNGPNRTVYSMGGYLNPLVSGDMDINRVYRYNPSTSPATWDGVSGLDAVIPKGPNGNLINGAATSPQGRYLHWMSATGGNHLLIGSGVSIDAALNESYPSDTWLWFDRSAEGFANQWLRLPEVTVSQNPLTPGKRESATAVFDENLREVVLTGGIDRTNSGFTTTTSSGRTYRGSNRSFTLEQSCDDTDFDGLCDDVNSDGINDVTLDVTFPSLAGVNCNNMQVLFVFRNATTGQWSTDLNLNGSPDELPLLANDSTGSCKATLTTAPWIDPYGMGGPNGEYIDNYGIMARDRRHATSGTHCSTAAAEITTITNIPPGRPACNPGFIGTGSCGGSVVNPTDFIFSIPCADY